MKRVYQKPALEVVAFEMNEAVASCNVAEDMEAMLKDFGFTLTGDAVDGACSSNPTYDYCYYTSVSTGSSGLLASS